MNILTIRIDTESEQRLAPEKQFGLQHEIDQLKRRVHRMEIRMSEYSDEIAQLNDATSLVATRVQGLIDQVAGLSGPDTVTAKQVAADLQPFVDHLKALGADPSNPVPPTPPTPPIPPAPPVTDPLPPPSDPGAGGIPPASGPTA